MSRTPQTNTSRTSYVKLPDIHKKDSTSKIPCKVSSIILFAKL